MAYLYIERRVYQIEFVPESPADIRVVVGIGPKKIPTILQYDENFENVISWGFAAMASEPKRKTKTKSTPSSLVELFKLHLGNIPNEQKPVLPSQITPERAITDYLRKMAEAAAVHCLKELKPNGLKAGIDLTVRKLLESNQLEEDTERSGDFCGSTYVDREFLKFLEDKVGKNAMKMLREKHYGQLSYIIQQFCDRVKIPFTGEKSEFRKYSLDIETKCPALKQYVSGSAKDELSDEDWEIDIDFATVKSFFDPVVNKILRLISAQLDKSACSVMFLVGGFSESKYLQQRIKQQFSEYKVAVPPYPIIAIANGAVEYGIDMDAIKNRVLKWTYGVAIYPEFQEGDPPSRKNSDGHIQKFHLMAKRGIQVEINQQFSTRQCPVEPDQTQIRFRFYYSSRETAQYCDEDGMNKLGEFLIDLPDTHLGINRPVLLSLYFGSMEIIAIAKNETNGKIYRTKFKLDL
ncbi:8783_t:CDS:2 [Racocetra fulgida]|uniref:8783_t:CDS:1 n=1 Tax=Racocetra fulgida TaxID=60492 RepID=A0A9N9FA47_9GLOM|nr:8783_t:CDS:2 [Racocetra fulgida]